MRLPLGGGRGAKVGSRSPIADPFLLMGLFSPLPALCFLQSGLGGDILSWSAVERLRVCALNLDLSCHARVQALSIGPTTLPLPTKAHKLAFPEVWLIHRDSYFPPEGPHKSYQKAKAPFSRSATSGQRTCLLLMPLRGEKRINPSKQLSSIKQLSS